MPLNVPPLEIVRALGNPVDVQEYPPVPPLAEKSIGPKDAPTVAAGSDDGPVIVKGAGFIVNGRTTFAVALLESFTVNCGLKLPGLPDGVPLNAPPELIAIPPGNPVAVQVYPPVPPLAPKLTGP